MYKSPLGNTQTQFMINCVCVLLGHNEMDEIETQFINLVNFVVTTVNTAATA